ncbi:CCCH zinc finger protein [Aspergillus homomorphus CBS 101889]|uniref:C3H1-type domain-containing protein n=1 Tax=Aspergillus homomorphus (strain CBS 101889) TaxID=1450537 RepID=A0A395I9V4_ASPHC|nr:hypothetical protein BO97DRAFT_468849 [Aspergillus homomorphus CBS 101889]RAL14924.1 hypothetical protein BO97DRAFT_468849 [Aspergillus homomorphus CBS 101889]
MTTSTYLDRYRSLAYAEQKKNLLIEELLQRVAQLEDAYEQEKLDHNREKRFNREIQVHEMELMEQLSRFQLSTNRKPYIIALLDGSGIIFQDEFLKKGGQGGKLAAQKLHQELEVFVANQLPSARSPKVLVRMYVNVKGLNEACVRGGITTDPALLEDFTRGFNSGYPSFDIVDIGAGTDSAHDKIAEAFELNLYNCHCHQLLLGCADEKSFFQILGDSLHDKDLMGRVTLIEALPFGENLNAVRASFRTMSCSEIFRESKICPIWSPWKAAVATQPRSLLTPSPKLETKPSPPRASLTRTSTSVSAPLSPYTSSSRPSSPEEEFQVVRGKAAAAPARPKVVERNKFGQRVDRLDLKNINQQEMNRLKKLKLCNFYYLQGECPVDDCQHDHSHKLTRNEHVILAAIARMIPCRYGLECDEPECTYGHRCPYSEPGERECHWGSSCRFDPASHGIDTTIVKVTKI